MKSLFIDRSQSKMHFLERLNFQKSAAWMETTGSLIELSFPNWKVWIGTLVGGIMPVVTEK